MMIDHSIDSTFKLSGEEIQEMDIKTFRKLTKTSLQRKFVLYDPIKKEQIVCRLLIEIDKREVNLLYDISSCIFYVRYLPDRAIILFFNVLIEDRRRNFCFEFLVGSKGSGADSKTFDPRNSKNLSIGIKGRQFSENPIAKSLSDFSICYDEQNERLFIVWGFVEETLTKRRKVNETILSLELIDPNTKDVQPERSGIWREFRSSLSSEQFEKVHRSGVSAVFKNNKIYVFGGCQKQNLMRICNDIIEISIKKSGTWEMVTLPKIDSDLTEFRPKINAVAIDLEESILILGGKNDRAFNHEKESQAFVFDFSKKTIKKIDRISFGQNYSSLSELSGPSLNIYKEPIERNMFYINQTTIGKSSRRPSMFDSENSTKNEKNVIEDEISVDYCRILNESFLFQIKYSEAEGLKLDKKKKIVLANDRDLRNRVKTISQSFQERQPSCPLFFDEKNLRIWKVEKNGISWFELDLQTSNIMKKYCSSEKSFPPMMRAESIRTNHFFF